MITIFGFIKIGETGYSEITFVKENSGSQGIGEPSLGDAIILELETTKGVHYVDRTGDAIKVMGYLPLEELKTHINKAFTHVYGVTPHYVFERVMH